MAKVAEGLLGARRRGLGRRTRRRGTEETIERDGNGRRKRQERAKVEKMRGFAGPDERTLTSYYLLIANSFSLVAY